MKNKIQDHFLRMEWVDVAALTLQSLLPRFPTDFSFSSVLFISAVVLPMGVTTALMTPSLGSVDVLHWFKGDPDNQDGNSCGSEFALGTICVVAVVSSSPSAGDSLQESERIRITLGRFLSRFDSSRII